MFCLAAGANIWVVYLKMLHITTVESHVCVLQSVLCVFASQSRVSIQLMGQRAIIFTQARQQMLHLSSCPSLSTPSVWQAWEAEPTHRWTIKVSTEWSAAAWSVHLHCLALSVCRCAGSGSFPLSYCCNEGDKWSDREGCDTETERVGREGGRYKSSCVL